MRLVYKKTIVEQLDELIYNRIRTIDHIEMSKDEYIQLKKELNVFTDCPLLCYLEIRIQVIE